MIDRVKRVLFPHIDAEVKQNLDRESVKNLYHFFFIVLFLELLTLAVYIFTIKQFDRSAWISLGSVSFCILICLFGHLGARAIIKKPELSHRRVTMFKSACFIVFSIWSVWVSYRQYQRNDQLLTFFTVNLAMVCFMLLRPWIGAVLMSAVFALLYAVVHSIDGAAQINVFNYIVCMLVSVAGMIVRYHSQIRMSEKAIGLKKTNDLLEHATLHDWLTGLRNRKALDADIAGLVGRHVWAFMIDINYFKDINDSIGHAAGDEVLQETGRTLKKLYPDSLWYRYGGDEFLVLNTTGKTYGEDVYRFSFPGRIKTDLLLSIGHADGTPEDSQQLYRLIAAADASLYEVKRRTHTPEYGGHDRRHRA